MCWKKLIIKFILESHLTTSGLLEEGLIKKQKTKMKKSVLNGVVALVMLVSMANTAMGQCKEWKWPEDGTMKAKTEENVSLYTDYKKNSEFHKAAGPLNWLLTNTPNLNTSIYINGTEIYDKLASAAVKEKSPRASILVDSLLLIYDLRIKNCGEEASVLNRKALSAAQYNLNTAGKEAGVLDLFDKAFELNGNSILDYTLVPYMQVIKVNKLKLKNLTDEQVLQRYDKVSEIIDAKIKKALSEGKPVTSLNETKEKIDQILITIVKVDCDFVRKNLAPKFRANPSDVGLAKKIFAFMLKDNCIEDPLWLEAGEAIHNGDAGTKDFGLAKNLGKGYYRIEKFDKAEFYFKEALELATTPTDKGDILVLMGNNEVRKGNKPAARDLFRQAIAVDNANKDAYERIGDLYQASFKECAQEKSYAEDRLIYIAAYEMYVKAGNSQKMAQAKSQFPSVSELFDLNWQVGEIKRVGCWINEAVKLDTRGKD
jgi:tetratricopeptide (TPR) repeat protein